MALTSSANAAIAELSFDALNGAESMKLHAYSGFTLLFILNAATDTKVLRKHLSAQARKTGLIAANTWESYVKGVDTAAGMFREHAPAEVAAILDMDVAEAVDAVRSLYEGLNILSGSDIRAWATAGEFAPLDKEAAKRAKAEAAKAKRQAAEDEAAARFFAGAAPATIADMGGASAAPATAIEAVLAMIGTLGHADAAKAMAALNAHIVALDAAVEAAPAPTVAPVLADDALVSAKSSLAAHFNAKAA